MSSFSSIRYKSAHGQLLAALECGVDEDAALAPIILWWKQYWTANPDSSYTDCKTAIDAFSGWNEVAVTDALNTFVQTEMDLNLLEFVNLAFSAFCPDK